MSGYARNLRKECAGLVAGQAVLTAEIRIEAVEDLWTDLGHFRQIELPSAWPLSSLWQSESVNTKSMDAATSNGKQAIKVVRI